MKAELFKRPRFQNIQDDQESEAAEYDQPAGGKIQKYVILIWDQIGQPAQDIKPGIIKRSY